LIEAYEQEVNYQLGKANVTADTMSCKTHYNYLPTICLIGEESSTWALMNLSLFNITLTPILRDEIIAAQKNDEGMTHIKIRMQEGDPKVACFHEDAKG
jgi:predicted transposase YbfD/YdcC